MHTPSFAACVAAYILMPATTPCVVASPSFAPPERVAAFSVAAWNPMRGRRPMTSSDPVALSSLGSICRMDYTVLFRCTQRAISAKSRRGCRSSPPQWVCSLQQSRSQWAVHAFPEASGLYCGIASL